MKQLSLLLALFLLPCFYQVASAQQTLISPANPINDKIAEVYGNSYINDNPAMYQHFYKLLLGRVHYKRVSQTPSDKYILLSQVALSNKVNPGITRDQVFNAQTFNPLKYQMNFFPKTTQVYRFDNSDMLIVIDPL